MSYDRTVFQDDKAFVEISPLYDLDLLFGEKDKDLVHTNIPCEDFWYQLEDYENTHSRNYTKLKTRQAMLAVVMVPKNLKGKFLRNFTADFMRDFSPDGTVLPYTAFKAKKGRGKYLHIYYSERTYSEEGYEKPVVSKGDFYRDSVTGKRTTKDNPNAVLERKNGDVIGYKYEHFSNKLMCCGSGSPDAFNDFVDYLKALLMKLLAKIGYDIEKAVHVKKFNRENFKGNPFAIRNVAKINQLGNHIEAGLNRLSFILNRGEYLKDYDLADEFFKLVNKWTSIFSNKRIKYNKRYTLFFNFYNKWYSVDAGIEYVIDKFNAELDKFYFKYIYDPNMLPKKYRLKVKA